MKSCNRLRIRKKKNTRHVTNSRAKEGGRLLAHKKKRTHYREQSKNIFWFSKFEINDMTSSNIKCIIYDDIYVDVWLYVS